MRQKIFFPLFICCLVWVGFPLFAVEAGNEVNASLFAKALYESKEGNFVDALESWDRFLVSAPTDAAALSNRGNVRLALGDSEGAILDQTSAIKILPSETDPYLNRGIAEETLGQWDEAINDYQWVLTREPENASALYNLGNVVGSVRGDWLQAKELFNKASIANPGDVMARSSNALASYQLNDFAQAEKELRTLIRKYPMFADARAALTALLWREGSLGEAESHWTAAIGLDSRYREEKWLVNVRRWPSDPIHDLKAFLDLESV